MSASAASLLDDVGRLRDHTIVVALGGNLGGSTIVRQRCLDVIERLSQDWGPAIVSTYWLTAPVGAVQEQADFVNAVAVWRPQESPVSPEAVLFALQRLELVHKRERLQPGGARTLDLDLLLVGSEHRCHEALLLPHPRMGSRAFVLRPLAELFGDGFVWLPGGQSVSQCLASAEVNEQRLAPLP